MYGGHIFNNIPLKQDCGCVSFDIYFTRAQAGERTEIAEGHSVKWSWTLKFFEEKGKKNVTAKCNRAATVAVCFRGPDISCLVFPMLNLFNVFVAEVCLRALNDTHVNISCSNSYVAETRF